jgi:hypothetical protein
MSKCPQASPARKAHALIGECILELVAPLQTLLPLEVAYKLIVPFVLNESQFPALHAGYPNANGVRKALLGKLPPDGPDFVAGVQAMVAPVCICNLAHIFWHVHPFDGGMLAFIADKRRSLDSIRLFLNCSVDFCKLTDKCASVANKALHSFIPAFQSGCILNKQKRLSIKQYFRYITARLFPKHVDFQENWIILSPAHFGSLER